MTQEQIADHLGGNYIGDSVLCLFRYADSTDDGISNIEYEIAEMQKALKLINDLKNAPL